MCGRFTQHVSWQEIVETYRLTDDVPALNLRPNYNVAPTHDVLTLRLEDGKLTPSLMRWGLVPFWAKDLKIGYKTFNARSETIDKTNSYRTAFRKGRRCIIPADGFYEWKGPKGDKQPYYIRRADGELMSFAGLWETWDKEGETVLSCTIATTEPNDFMTDLHNRMPAILDDYSGWLDGSAGKDALAPYEGELTAHPVDRRVGSVKNNELSLIEPVSV